MTKLTTASYVKITLIIVLGLLILGSIGFGGCSAMRFGMLGGTEMGSANVDAASVKNLSVKWASGAVSIDVVDEGDAIELVETAPRGMTKAQQMRWSVNGDTLSIDYGTWFSCFALGRKDLQVRIPVQKKQGCLHLLVDSTGIKMMGEGEWNVKKHDADYRRQWRKLHLGIDAQTLEIRAMEVTDNRTGDATMLPKLLS